VFELSGALCRGKDKLFDSTHPSDHEAAAALCRACPAIEACTELLGLEFSATRGASTSPEGTWAGQLIGGGSTRWKAREHGTDRGYYQHKYRHEDVCSACRVAHAARWRDLHRGSTEGVNAGLLTIRGRRNDGLMQRKSG
jgi:hypothetical protein